MSKEELLERLEKLDLAVDEMVTHCDEIMDVCEELGKRIDDLRKECDEE